jgi:hypothetical protein
MEISKDDVDRLSEGFETLCAIRHAKGAKEYGELTFADNDIIRMMAEELADTANYCRYQFIKLMKLQEMLHEQHPEMNQAFNGTRAGWNVS